MSHSIPSSRDPVPSNTSSAALRGVPVDEMSWGPVENARVVRIPDFCAQPLRA